MTSNTPNRVYFFLPLDEVLALPQEAFVPDLHGIMPGEQAYAKDSQTVLTDNRLRSVSIIPRQIQVEASQVFEPLVSVTDVMFHVVPWAYPSKRFRFLSRFLRRLPRRSNGIMLDRTIIEASVIMPNDWAPYSATQESEEDKILEAALNDAIEAINNFQVLAYIATGRATTPVTPQKLPFMILFVVGQMDEQRKMIPHPKGCTGMFLNHLGQHAHDLRHHVPESIPTGEELSAMPLSPFEKVSELAMEAESLLTLSGQLRASLIMTATACETLLNTTLTLLLWEAQVSPEKAASDFRANVPLKTRVARNFPRLLGGDWDPKKVAALRLWLIEVVEPRNQIVHRGVSVSQHDAERAQSAYVNLRYFLAERLWREPQRSPFTAITYSSSMLTWPQQAEKKISSLPSASYKEPSELAYALWNNCLSSILADDIAMRIPSFHSGGLIAVVNHLHEFYWVWHDWATAKACLVVVRRESTIESLRQRMRRHGPTYQSCTWLSFSFSDSHTQSHAAWVEEHKLVPGLGVLPDQSDLDSVISNAGAQTQQLRNTAQDTSGTHEATTE